MDRFAALYAAVDETTKTTEKVAAVAAYLASAGPADAAWAVYFLTGRKPRQVVPTKLLRAWATDAAGVPDWLFGECYHAAGDLAETVALLVPGPARGSDAPLREWVEDRLLPLRGLDPAAQRKAVVAAWAALDGRQRFVWNKLITGSLRVGVSQLLVVRALADVSGLPAPTVSHRLTGDWRPTADWYLRLIAPDDDGTADPAKPYPFFLASPLAGGPEALGPPADWLAEWKWDGIRAQVVRRAGHTAIWSRGEELVTDRFPEVAGAAARLPDGTVLDGELLPWGPAGARPFADLQKRIGRKSLTRKLLADVPVVLLAYDLLEADGRDLRGEPLSARRGRLEAVVGGLPKPAASAAVRSLFPDPDDDRPAGGGPIRLSPVVPFASWDELAAVRADSRGHLAEGLMLKRAASAYQVGRARGDWWKWKVDPYSVDAVLVAAQRGTGKRAGLYTDYTFAVWDGGELVPFAKAYSGLTDAEIRDVDGFVRRHTVDQFGPVRAVTPELVFEVGFEGIQRSPRHKSGVAVRFPRILRQRPDKSPADADTLDAVRRLLPAPPG